MWFLYNTNHLRIMAVWNEAQGVVRKMLQCLEEYEKVFWGAETASFAGSLTYIFFNLQSHWRIWRTSEWENTWNMEMVFSTISSLRISESRAFFATHRTSVLPMLEASTFFSCIASSLCHQKQQNPIGRWLCFTWSFLLQRGVPAWKGAVIYLFFFGLWPFSLAGNLRQLWPCYTLLELVMSGSEASGFASKSDHGGSMTVPWPDSSMVPQEYFKSALLMYCYHVVLILRIMRLTQG